MKHRNTSTSFSWLAVSADPSTIPPSFLARFPLQSLILNSSSLLKKKKVYFPLNTKSFKTFAKFSPRRKLLSSDKLAELRLWPLPFFFSLSDSDGRKSFEKKSSAIIAKIKICFNTLNSLSYHQASIGDNQDVHLPYGYTFLQQLVGLERLTTLCSQRNMDRRYTRCKPDFCRLYIDCPVILSMEIEF